MTRKHVLTFMDVMTFMNVMTLQYFDFFNVMALTNLIMTFMNVRHCHKLH